MGTRADEEQNRPLYSLQHPGVSQVREDWARNAEHLSDPIFRGDGLERLREVSDFVAAKQGNRLFRLLVTDLHDLNEPAVPQGLETSPGDVEFCGGLAGGQVSKGPLTSAVVVREIGLPGTKEGKDIQKAFQDIAAKALPLAPKPELPTVRSALMAEFPYAQAVIDAMLGDLVPRSTSFVRPTVLVGTPGSGKTRFARQILTLLGIPHEVVSCGGIADGSFGGTARRWSTGEPALPVGAFARHKHAGPGIVLDEVEKVGVSRHNGNAHDVLLGFFERETNRAFFDPYLQADCDLSHVSWLATANSLEGVSAPLRDRCRITMFPEPGPEHLAALAPRVIAELLADQGLDARWASPLEGYEMDALAAAWPGGSMRKLRRLVEAVLAARVLPAA